MTVAIPSLTLAAKDQAGSTVNTKTLPLNENGAVATGLEPTENVIGVVGGLSLPVSATLTRPNDTNAYVLGDVVGANTAVNAANISSLALARKNAGSGVIHRVRLKKTSNVITNAQFRVHFFKNSPTLTVGDNGVFAGNTTESNWIGYVDVAMDMVFSDAAKGIGIPIQDMVFDAAAGTQLIYAVIETRAAYTPVANEIFTITVEVLRD